MIDGTDTPAGEVPLVLIADEPPDALGARLAGLARAGALRGRIVAIWSLAGPVRPDVIAALVTDGGAATVGVADVAVGGARDEIARTLDAVSQAVRGGARRPETLPGPWLWIY